MGSGLLDQGRSPWKGAHCVGQGLPAVLGAFNRDPERSAGWEGRSQAQTMMLAPQPCTGQRGGAENDEGAETDPEKEETGADPVRKWAQSEEDGRTSPGHESSPFRVQRPGHTAAHKASCHVSAAELAVSVAGHLSHRTFGTLQHRAERTVAQQRPPLPSSRALSPGHQHHRLALS